MVNKEEICQAVRDTVRYIIADYIATGFGSRDVLVARIASHLHLTVSNQVADWLVTHRINGAYPNYCDIAVWLKFDINDHLDTQLYFDIEDFLESDDISDPEREFFGASWKTMI